MNSLLLLACADGTVSEKPGEGTESEPEAGAEDPTPEPEDDAPLPESCVAAGWSWGETLTVEDADASWVGEHGGAWAGAWLTAPGDLDGDGAGDVLVGSPFYGTDEVGRVYVVHGARTRAKGQSLGDWPGVSGTESRAEFSQTVPVGDLDRDGLADFVIHPGYQSTATEQQYLFLGRDTGWADLAGVADADAATTDPEPECSGCVTRNDVALGDVDGDGVGDWLVSSNHVANGQGMVVSGAARGVVTIPDAAIAWIVGDVYQTTFVAIGDVDGDGLGDIAGRADSGANLVIPATAATASGAAADSAASWFVGGGHSVLDPADLTGDGIVELMLRSSSEVLGFRGGVARSGAGQPDFRIAVDAFISDAASVGDVNGDGIADLAIVVGDGTIFADAYVYFGRADWAEELSLAEADVHLAFPADQRRRLYAPSERMLGDIDGDGIGDLLIASPAEDRMGALRVYRGRAAWPAELGASDADLTLLGTIVNQSMGDTQWTAVTDIDGDGCEEILSSSYYHPVTSDPNGEIFIFHGQY